jgi:hypothetical protein
MDRFPANLRNLRFMAIDLALAVGVMLIMALLSPDADALTAREIMEKVDARYTGDTMVADQEWTLISNNGYERYRRTKAFLKEKGEKTLGIMFFLSPADIKGTGFLVHDYHSGEKDSEQWLYLPALHKTKRIASSGRSASFMGSDLSYADMSRLVLNDWNYRLLGEEEIDGCKAWAIELLPKTPEVARRYGYIRSVLFVRQDIFTVIRAIHWMDKGNKTKYFDVRKLERIDSIWVSTEMQVKTLQGNMELHQTLLTLKNVRINENLNESMFTLRQLEKGL